MSDDKLNVITEKFVDLLPQINPPPALSATSDRPPPGEEPAKSERTEPAEAAEQAATDKDKAAADATAQEPEKTESVESEKAPTIEEKAYITREKNKRRRLEDDLTLTKQQLTDALALAARYVPKPATKAEPQPSEFTTTDDFIEARADWLADQKVAARVQAEQRQRAESEQQRVQREHQERIAKAEDKYPGISEVARDPTLPVSEAMGAAILTSDQGPAILNWLDQHRDEAAKIRNMAPIRAAAEIGKIEANLATIVPAKVSSAPKPVAPLNGGKDNVQKSEADMTHDEYWAAYEQRKKDKIQRMSRH